MIGGAIAPPPPPWRRPCSQVACLQRSKLKLKSSANILEDTLAHAVLKKDVVCNISMGSI